MSGDSFVSALVGAIVSAPVVAALIEVWTGRRLATQKAQFDTDLARLSSQLDSERSLREEEQRRVSDQLSTEYSWLYVERAKAMLEIYSRLIDAEEAFRHFGASIGTFPGQSGPKDRMQKATDAGIAFQKAYLPKRIFFRKKLADTFEELNRAYVAMHNNCVKFLAMTSGDEYEAYRKTMEMEIPDTRNIIDELELEFRRLYGQEIEGK